MTALEGVGVGHQAESRGRAFQAEVKAQADPKLKMRICTAEWLELNGPRRKPRVRLAGRLQHVWASLCKSEGTAFYSELKNTEGFLAQSGKGRAREHELQRGSTSAEVKGEVAGSDTFQGVALIRPADGPDT